MYQSNKVLITILMVAMIFSLGFSKSCSQVTDYDGNEYKTVKIGTQEWTTENLDVEHYSNGDIIPQIKDNDEWAKLKTGAWCYFDNNSENGKVYGKLYNWFAVNDPRGLAPEGWHIPSDAEWTTLTEFLGGETVAGGKLKDTTLWNSPNTGATNESGFTAFPGGFRYGGGYGNFSNIGISGYFWSSSDNKFNHGYAMPRGLEYYNSNVSRGEGGYNKGMGFSVRCVRDYEETDNYDNRGNYGIKNNNFDAEDSNLYSQRNYKDNIQSDISLYAGVYEGNIEFPGEGGNYITEFGTIIFYYNGVSLKCLYDGLFLNILSLSGNIVRDTEFTINIVSDTEFTVLRKILGKFVKNNEEGFLHYGRESYTFKYGSDGLPIGDSFFLKKIGDSEMASKIYLNAEKELNEFKDFEILFRKAFVNRNEKKLLSMINLPFYDIWRDKEYKSKSELKGFIKKANILETSLSESRHKNQNNSFEGAYEIHGINESEDYGIIFYFKKIGTEFKLVFTTGVAG